MEMPLCLLAQTVELIRQRRTDEARLQMRITEWQTKQLAATMIQIAVDVQEQGRKELLRGVQKMTLDAKDVGEATPDKEGDDFSYIEEGASIDDSQLPSSEMFQMIAAGGPR